MSNPESVTVFNNEIWLIDDSTGIWNSINGKDWTAFDNKDIILNYSALLQWDSKMWILGGFWHNDEKIKRRKYGVVEME